MSCWALGGLITGHEKFDSEAENVPPFIPPKRFLINWIGWRARKSFYIPFAQRAIHDDCEWDRTSAHNKITRNATQQCVNATIYSEDAANLSSWPGPPLTMPWSPNLGPDHYSNLVPMPAIHSLLVYFFFFWNGLLGCFCVATGHAYRSLPSPFRRFTGWLVWRGAPKTFLDLISTH